MISNLSFYSLTAFIVCGIALIFFIGLTVALILRSKRKDKKLNTSSGKPLTSLGMDEEEGLLNANAQIGVDEDEDTITMAKLRQGPKKSKGLGRSPDGDGDEDEGRDRVSVKGGRGMGGKWEGNKNLGIKV